MLKAELFTIASDSCKSFDYDGFTLLDIVKTVVRTNELKSITDNKTFINNKKAIEDAHANINPMTCDESIVLEVLKDDAGDFIKKRKEVIALQEELATLPGIDKFTALPQNDRVQILLKAHTISGKITLDTVDDTLFNTEKGGIDLSAFVANYYKSGKIDTSTKNALVAIFHKLVGEETEHFYPVKVRKSSFTGEEIRHFFAAFGGSAKREKMTKKVDGKDVVSYNPFNYVDKSKNEKVMYRAFTDLCAIILDNNGRHEVVKPDTEKALEETK